MKKIVTLGAIAALAGGMIFADPVANLSIAEFSGYGKAQWGVDLDAGQTGFENDEKVKLVISLFDAGAKSTEKTSDIWGEFVLKAGNTQWWTHQIEAENEKIGGQAGTGGLGSNNISIGVDTVKLHFGDKVYVGLRSGDTQVGEYKFDGAIRSADNDHAKWLTNVGPDKFSQGIVLGYTDDNFGVDVDFRSFYSDKTNTFYTGAYAIAAEAQLKDSNSFVPGLKVDLGGAYNFSDKYYTSSKGEAAKDAVTEPVYGWVDDDDDPTTAPTWGIITPVSAAVPAVQGGKVTENNFDYIGVKNAHNLSYAGNLSYKFKLDDKYYVKPAVGYTGTFLSGTNSADKAVTKLTNNLVAGVLFGWGDPADANAGVYFLDGDYAKKVTPGISVVAAIPLPTVSTTDGTKSGSADKAVAIIVPSVYLGDLVENLKFGAYSEMAILRAKAETKDDIVYAAAADETRTFALGVAAGVAYDIKATDALTITPKAGVRFANTAYFDEEISGYAPLSSDKIFDNMGIDGKAKADGDYKNKLNLKAGVDVNGLIANTTIFVEYASANLLNDNVYDDKYYNVKLGTLNIGAKLSF